MMNTLDHLQPGQHGQITRLNSTGLYRRRLLDLGFVPGTPITVAFASPMGDPVAYRVRGTIIALRLAQAREVEIDIEGQQDA